MQYKSFRMKRPPFRRGGFPQRENYFDLFESLALNKHL